MSFKLLLFVLILVVSTGIAAAGDVYITTEGVYHNSVGTRYYWTGGGTVDVHASSHHLAQHRGAPCRLESYISTDAGGGQVWYSPSAYVDNDCDTHHSSPSAVSTSFSISNGDNVHCRGSGSSGCVICTPGDNSNSNTVTFSSGPTYTVSGSTDCLDDVTLYVYDGIDYQYQNHTTLGSSYSFPVFMNHDYMLVFSNGAYYNFTCDGNEVFDYDACIWVYGYTCGVDNIKLYKDDSGWVLDDTASRDVGYDVYEMPIVDEEDYKISFIDSTIDGDIVVHNETFSCTGDHVLIDFDRCNWVYPPNGHPVPIYLWTGYDYNIVVFKDEHGNFIENSQLAIYDMTSGNYIQKWTPTNDGYALLGARFDTDHDVLLSLKTFDGIFNMETTYPANGSAPVGEEIITTTNWTVPIRYNVDIFPVDVGGMPILDVFCGLSEYTPLNPGAFWGMDLSDQGVISVSSCSGFAMCDIMAEKAGYTNYTTTALNWTSKSALTKDYRHNIIMEEE